MLLVETAQQDKSGKLTELRSMAVKSIEDGNLVSISDIIAGVANRKSLSWYITVDYGYIIILHSSVLPPIHVF